MFKKCKVVMLPTSEKASEGQICLNNSYLPHLTQPLVKGYDSPHLTPQHLYILSDEKIKENTNTFKEGLNGDWFYNTIYNSIAHIGDITDYDFKIIASTDLSLGKSKKEYNDKLGLKIEETKYFPLPLISQSFIDKYISKYNKGNKIKDVLVEYEDITIGELGFAGLSNHTENKLKVNLINTINIKSIKDNWTKEEVVELIKKYGKDIHKYEISKESFNDWVETNL